MKYNKFCYNEILTNAKQNGKDTQYLEGSHKIAYNQGFIQIGESSDEKCTGWKLHLSVKPEDLAKAWDGIIEYLLDNKLIPVKVVLPEVARKFGHTEELQAGKMIVIYDEQPNRNRGNWAGHLQNIENILTQNHIKPGKTVRFDKKLEGSDYIYYRNDSNKQGEYIPARQLEKLVGDNIEKAYNPYNKPDPFIKIDVSTAHQKPKDAQLPPSISQRPVFPRQTILERLASLLAGSQGGKLTHRQDNGAPILYVPVEDSRKRDSISSLLNEIGLNITGIYLKAPKAGGDPSKSESGLYIEGALIVNLMLKALKSAGVEVEGTLSKSGKNPSRETPGSLGFNGPN